MRFTLGITTKYIDHHPTASMTNNPLTGISFEQITALSKVCNVNENECPWTQECCFLPSGYNLRAFCHSPRLNRGMNPTIEHKYQLLESLVSTWPR
jgi:hypothetical protein